MKKTAIIILFMLLVASLNAATYYVAPNGNDNNPGTISQPWATWQKGFSSLSAGDILYIRGGTYTGMYDSEFGVLISYKSGTASNPIKVFAYPGETPVLDCSSLSASPGVNFGMRIEGCNYWHFKGLTVKSVREYKNLHASAGGVPVAAWELSSCNNITTEQCIVTDCGNGFTLNGTVNNILYLNCDSYYNYDYVDAGGLANGFNGNVRGQSTVTFTGCRAWANSDDGFDNMGGAGYITYNNCWAYGNGKGAPTGGNGDGFKLGFDDSGTEVAGVQRTVNNCIASDNILMGFDESMDVATSMDMVLNNCISYKNSRDYGFRFYQPLGTGVATLRNNIAYLNNVDYLGRSRNITDHDTWNSGAPTVSDADFVSVDVSELGRPRKSDGSLPDINFLHLAPGSDLIDAGVDVGLPYSGKAPDLGPFEYTAAVTSVPNPPVYVSSEVRNTAASDIVLTYDISLANILPATSAFVVKVNNVTQAVSKVTISDKNVILTLSSPAVYGNAVSVSYTKPAANPLQSTANVPAESIANKAVTNNIIAVPPLYVNSVVEAAAPGRIEMTYNTNLANVVPSSSAFTATVNGVRRNIGTVAISGTKVNLTLDGNVNAGDTVKISYIKPASNPLQTVTGATADNISDKPVTNNVLGVVTDTNNTTPKLFSIYPNPAHDYLQLSNLEPSADPQILRIFDFSGKLCKEIKLDVSANQKIQINLKPGMYILQVLSGQIIKHTQRVIVI